MSDIEKIKKDWMKKWSKSEPKILDVVWNIYSKNNNYISVNGNIDLADYILVVYQIVTTPEPQKKVMRKDRLDSGYDQLKINDEYKDKKNRIENLKEFFEEEFFKTFQEMQNPEIQEEEIKKTYTYSDQWYLHIYEYWVLNENISDIEIIKKKKSIEKKIDNTEDIIVGKIIDNFNEKTNKDFINEFINVTGKENAYTFSYNYNEMKKFFEKFEGENFLSEMNLLSEFINGYLHRMYHSGKIEVTPSKGFFGSPKISTRKDDVNNEKDEKEVESNTKQNDSKSFLSRFGFGGKRKTKKSKRKTNKKKSMKKRKMKKTKKSKK